MNVAEKDIAVHGMLEEEYLRCKEVLAALEKKLDLYPKGALNIRKKHYKGKEYSYHYIVLREEGQVINRHVSDGDLPLLKDQLEQREKCSREIRSYKHRIVYLEKLLHIPRRKKRSDENPA